MDGLYFCCETLDFCNNYGEVPSKTAARSLFIDLVQDLQGNLHLV